jgi:hypothetical protein
VIDTLRIKGGKDRLEWDKDRLKWDREGSKGVDSTFYPA